MLGPQEGRRFLFTLRPKGVYGDHSHAMCGMSIYWVSEWIHTVTWGGGEVIGTSFQATTYRYRKIETTVYQQTMHLYKHTYACIRAYIGCIRCCLSTAQTRHGGPAAPACQATL
jgi:hypothetical protein